jgi:hypothetical protein
LTNVLEMPSKKSLEFMRQSLKEAVQRMSADLRHANKVAHELKRIDAAGEGDGSQDFDRTVELGSLVETAANMCPSSLAFLNEIADFLCGAPMSTRSAYKACNWPHMPYACCSCC